MQRIYGICALIAVSQVVLGALALLAAVVIRCAGTGGLCVGRREKRRPLWWWLTVGGLWLVTSAFIELAILNLSFYPVRQA